MKSICLFYNDLNTGGTSDKEYRARVVKQGSGFVVLFEYGRRGGTLQNGTKTLSPIDLAEATTIFDRLVAEKMRNGYQSSPDMRSSGYIARHDPDAMEAEILNAQAARTTFPVELLEEIGEHDVERFIKSPNYFVQLKADGERRQIAKTDSGVIGYNKRGLPVLIPAALTQEIMRVNSTNAMFDGEIIGEKYLVYDLLRVEGVSIASEPYEQRLARASVIVPRRSELVEIIPTWDTTATKQAAIADCYKNRSEGVVFKLRTAPYRAGESCQHKKFKFLKSASCKVLAVRVKGKSNASVGLLNAQGKWQEVATVSTIGKGSIAVGQIVEVIFLNATAGHRLYQPRIKEIREDVDLKDCTFARQLKPEVYKQGIAA